jgi:hypothetical protein
MEKARKSVSKVLRCERQWFREFLAEMIGTMFLVVSYLVLLSKFENCFVQQVKPAAKN